MNDKNTAPLPLFDSIEFIKDQKIPKHLKHASKKDYLITKKFLESYTGSQGTFNSYRREVERLLHWCNYIINKSLKQLNREDIEAFICFCKAPPASWIGRDKPKRYVIKNGLRVSNTEWRPFVVTISKVDRKSVV